MARKKKKPDWTLGEGIPAIEEGFKAQAADPPGWYLKILRPPSKKKHK